MAVFNQRFRVVWNPKLRMTALKAIAHASGKPAKTIPPMSDSALWEALRGLYKPPCRYGFSLWDVPAIARLSDAEQTALILGTSEQSPDLPTGHDRVSFFASMNLDVLDLERQLCGIAREGRNVITASAGWYAPFIERLSPLPSPWTLDEIPDGEDLSAHQDLCRRFAAGESPDVDPEDLAEIRAILGTA